MTKNRRTLTLGLLSIVSLFALLLGITTAGQAGASVNNSNNPSAAAGFLIKSDLNGRCIDIQNVNPNNGALLQMWDCHGTAGQRWYWDGRMLRSDLNGRCIDIQNVNPNNGALLQMWDCHGTAGQRWSVG